MNKFTAIILILLLVIYGLFLLSSSYTYWLDTHQNLVLITSVIHTVNAPLSYSDSRSVYKHSTRLEQTIKTIESVIKYIPDPYIVLIEGSDLTSEEEKTLINSGLNKIHKVSPQIKELINSPHKSVGEVNILLDYLKTMDGNEHYKTISKISGRYYLTDKFKWNKYPIDKALYQCDSDKWCNTRYYRFPMKYYHLFIKRLQNALETKSFIDGLDCVETFNMFSFFPESVRLMRNKDEMLGVKGNDSAAGSVVEDFTSL